MWLWLCECNTGTSPNPFAQLPDTMTPPAPICCARWACCKASMLCISSGEASEELTDLLAECDNVLPLVTLSRLTIPEAETSFVEAVTRLGWGKAATPKGEVPG